MNVIPKSKVLVNNKTEVFYIVDSFYTVELAVV